MKISAARFVVGFAGTWLILSAMSESDTTADLAASLAVTIAIGATYYMWTPVMSELGKLGISVGSSGGSNGSP